MCRSDAKHFVFHLIVTKSPLEVLVIAPKSLMKIKAEVPYHKSHMIKLGSKFRLDSKVYGLFMPTCCLPLVRCEWWPSPGLSDRGRKGGKRNSCGTSLQRNSFDWSGTGVFPCFKAVSNDDYGLEGGNVALFVTRFLRGNFPWGFITLKIKELFIFQKVKLGGGLETFAAWSLWHWVRFWAGMWEIHFKCVCWMLLGPESITPCFPM